MPGGEAAPVLPKWVEYLEALTLGKFVDGSAGEMEQHYYQMEVPAAMTGVKVVLVPVNGDSDLFVSFDHARPSRTDASSSCTGEGVEEARHGGGSGGGEVEEVRLW